MSYAIRDDYQGWRAVASADDLLAGEFYAETAPPSEYHRWRAGAWVLDVGEELAMRRSVLLAAINSEASTLLASLSAAYPDGEVQSWAQQTREAEALAVDPHASAPLLSAIATARGVLLDVLAERVRAKVSAYAAASGAIIGQRQALEDALMAIDLQAPGAAEQLAAIDIHVGWQGGVA